MLNISVNEIVGITGGKLVSGNMNYIIDNISHDSRTIKKGDFFIPIVGKNYDGHKFVYDAYKKGAVGAICNIEKFNSVKSIFKNNGKSDIPDDFILIKVDDTLRSLGYIAFFYRQRFKVKAIAISGSNGKTTTKELIYNMLLTKYNKKEILYTEKNFNNEIGVPLTIFKLNPQIKVFVAELGINHIGEMQRLARMVSPNIGVITNIGDTHLEFLKNNKIVAKAKSEMIPYIKDYLIVNFDDTYYNYFLNISHIKIKSFSLNIGINLADVNHFDDYESLGLDGFNVVYKGEKMHYGLVGEHNLQNVLAALTAVEDFKLPIKKVKKVIENFKPVQDRGNIIIRKKYKIYFDAYNANPSSVRATLYFVNNLDYKYKVAILGDMMELGKKAMKYHTEVLQYINNLNFNKVLTFGVIYKRVRKERDVNHQLVESFLDLDKLKQRFFEVANEFDSEFVVLVKGSRKMEMERLLNMI